MLRRVEWLYSHSQSVSYLTNNINQRSDLQCTIRFRLVLCFPFTYLIMSADSLLNLIYFRPNKECTLNENDRSRCTCHVCRLNLDLIDWYDRKNNWNCLFLARTASANSCKHFYTMRLNKIISYNTRNHLEFIHC